VDTENSVRIENAGFRSVREIIIVSTMTPFFIALLALVASTFRTRAAQQAEILAPAIRSPSYNKARHVVSIFGNRTACCGFGCPVSGRLAALAAHLKPDTVLRWHRRAFARYWTRKSRRRPGRPSLAAAIRDLIQQMSQANFLP
jgi:hypothetical protein